MEENSKIAYSEIFAIINLLEDEFCDRIPEKIKNFFNSERNKEYNPIIDIDEPLEKQNLKRETMVLLAILNLNYWCNSEEERQEILEELSKNNEVKEIEIEEKYNPDELFKQEKDNKWNIVEAPSNTQIVEYKEQNFIKKLLHRIVKFFKK